MPGYGWSWTPSAVVIGGGSLMGGRFNLLLSVVGALIIRG